MEAIKSHNNKNSSTLSSLRYITYGRWQCCRHDFSLLCVSRKVQVHYLWIHYSANFFSSIEYYDILCQHCYIFFFSSCFLFRDYIQNQLFGRHKIFISRLRWQIEILKGNFNMFNFSKISNYLWLLGILYEFQCGFKFKKILRHKSFFVYFWVIIQ